MILEKPIALVFVSIALAIIIFNVSYQLVRNSRRARKNGTRCELIFPGIKNVIPKPKSVIKPDYRRSDGWNMLDQPASHVVDAALVLVERANPYADAAVGAKVLCPVSPAPLSYNRPFQDTPIC